MGPLVTPVFLASAVLLVVAGLPKVGDPAPLVRAVRTTGLRLGPGAVRAFALAEVVVGLAAIVRPGRVPGLLVAVLYAVFSAFVGLALVRGGVLESCGCFGRSDTPPTRSHLAVTLLMAVSGLVLAVAPPASPWWALGTGALLRDAALAALVGGLAWAVMAVLPTVTPAAVRSTGTAEPGGRTGGTTSAPRRGQTFSIKRRTPAPLPDPTFPPAPQRG